MSKKSYEVHLYYHQTLIITVDAENKEQALEKAYQTDFSDPEICIQCGWEEDGDPEVIEV
jgi:hypothetical protein